MCIKEEDFELAENYARVKDFLEDNHGPWDPSSLQEAVESILYSLEGIDEILDNPDQYPEYFQ
jgi:hypothetical protein